MTSSHTNARLRNLGDLIAGVLNDHFDREIAPQLDHRGQRDTSEESFDALAHTVTVEGDWPRCAECGEYGSHEEHQPEALSMPDSAVWGAS